MSKTRIPYVINPDGNGFGPQYTPTYEEER